MRFINANIMSLNLALINLNGILLFLVLRETGELRDFREYEENLVITKVLRQDSDPREILEKMDYLDSLDNPDLRDF